MGFFDRLKSLVTGEMPLAAAGPGYNAPVARTPPARSGPGGPSPGGNALLEELAGYYQLYEERSHEDSIASSSFPNWFAGTVSDCFLAMRDHGFLEVYVGEVVEITEIYLGRVSLSNPLPKDGSPQRLDRIEGLAGSRLAREYFLWAYEEGADVPELRLPALRDGLARLSPSVFEAGFFPRGLQLSITSDEATLASVRADVVLAVAMVKALAG